MAKRFQASRKNLIEDVVQPPQLRQAPFAEACPVVSQMWFYERNCGFGPDDFGRYSETKAWFRCPVEVDHIFQSAIKKMNRSEASDSKVLGCPFCQGRRASISNSLASLYPEIAKEWMKYKNRIGPEQVSYGSKYKAWWKCKKGHVWQASVADRTHGNGCSRCNRGRPLNLCEYPDAFQQFDQTKNPGVNPRAISFDTKIVWRCVAEPTHETWISKFYRKATKARCPSCSNRRGSKNNNLKLTHPELASRWDVVKNGKLKPEMLTATSKKFVYWKCSKGPDHEWKSKVCVQANAKNSCPFCLHVRSSVTNVLTTVAPGLAQEWHREKNAGIEASQERARSRKMRWWMCSKCGNEWQAETSKRFLRGQGCPICVNSKW